MLKVQEMIFLLLFNGLTLGFLTVRTWSPTMDF